MKKDFKVVIADEFSGKEEEIFKDMDRPDKPICSNAEMV
jgi:hypothetical protein